jgi:hypothetical protein
VKAVIWFIVWDLLTYLLLHWLFPGYGFLRYALASAAVPFLSNVANVPWDRRR